MVTNLNFKNGYGCFDAIFIYAGKNIPVLYCALLLFKAAHVLIQPSSTVSMSLSRIFQSGTFLEVIKVIWHPNSGLSCNSRGDCNQGPKSNHTASTLPPRTIPGWHL